MTQPPACSVPAILAQFLRPDETPAVASLPSPPVLEHYVLENSWPLAAVLVIAALVAAWMLNRQSRARQAVMAGGGLLLVAAGVLIAGQMVTTTRESLIARTRTLVAATAAADTASLRDMLAGDIQLRAYFFNEPMKKDVVLDRVERYMGHEYPVQSHKIDSPQATIDGPNAARTQVHVVVTNPSATMYNVPVGSWWRVDWRMDKDGVWRVTQLECLQLDVVRAGEKVSP
jgi:hypothetical protein